MKKVLLYSTAIITVVAIVFMVTIGVFVTHFSRNIDYNLDEELFRKALSPPL